MFELRLPRSYDLDWLRVLAFLLLVFFHAAVLFQPDGIPNILNDEPNAVLGIFVSFSHQFRLSLLFLISGMGVYFALRKRTARAYFSERFQRLIIPLVFGILVIVPPMVFFEQRFNGSFKGDFVQFYGNLFNGTAYPNGQLSWHHYWFILYLFIFCSVTYPLFAYWSGAAGRARLKTITDRLQSRFAIYGVILPLVLVELTLRPIFPGFRDLISDWASFTHWLIIFICGYAFASSAILRTHIMSLRWNSLGLGCLSSLLLFWLFYDPIQMRLGKFEQVDIETVIAFTGFSVLRMIAIWAWILTFVGFSARHLNRPSPILSYLNRAVYPLFCLHLTATVILAYFILPTSWPIAVKYSALVIGTFTMVWIVYELIVRRLGRLGLLVGYR